MYAPLLNHSDRAKSYFDRAIKDAETLTPFERAKKQADRYNDTAGDLNDDGFDCKKCKNRGDYAEVVERNGTFYMALSPCRCMEIRRSIWRMRASGLEDTIRQCTFERFEVKHPWQEKMLGMAKSYADTGAQEGKWLFMGGAVGCGKTHICTAVCRTLLYAGMGVYYMPWMSDSIKLKAIVNDDPEEYHHHIRRMKTVDVLYIDDFFKPVAGEYGQLPPTPADIKLAYDIINYRYINHKPTIISSERYLPELMDIDEAVASRIYERANGYSLTLEHGREKNHRIVEIDML